MSLVDDSPDTSADLDPVLRAPRERTQSLNDVRAIIPESCYRRSAGRAALGLAQGLVLYALPMVGLVLVDAWWAVLGLWLLAGFAIAGLFVLGHDASHGALLESRRANRIVAQVCMAPSAHVEAAWDLGHNRIHHGYTTRQGFDFWRRRRRPFRRPGWRTSGASPTVRRTPVPPTPAPR